MRPSDATAASTGCCGPIFVDVEGDAYVFVAVRRDPTLDGLPNWLAQTCHVDPTAGDDAELRVEITERYHVDGQDGCIAFEDRFTTNLSLESAEPRPRVTTVQRALDQWYRENYGDSARSEE